MNRDVFSSFTAEVRYLENASDHCSFKLGGKLEYLICPKTTAELCECLKVLTNNLIPFKVIGNMSNILPGDGINRGVFLTTKYIVEKIALHGTRVTVSSGTCLSEVCRYAVEHSLSGLERLIGIPGTIGGAVFNNAGAFGQSISDTLESLLVFINGKLVSKPAGFADLSYRHSAFKNNGAIIISATFNLKPLQMQTIKQSMKEAALKRISTQPQAPSAGSVFKKHTEGAAGMLIQNAGLKGTIYKGAQISDIHANFIINLGTASAESVKYLVNLAQSEVYKKFNIKLEREIEYLGETYECTSRLPYSQQI